MNTRSKGKRLRSAKILTPIQPPIKKYFRSKALNSGGTSRNPAPKSTSQASTVDYIEVSSGDEDPMPRNQARTERNFSASQTRLEILYGRIAMLKESVRSVKTALTARDESIKDLNEALAQAQKDQEAIRVRMEEALSCAICAEVLWEPYILPTCGHTLCGECLNSWDDAIGAAAHQNRARVEGVQAPEPPFTCPTCRTPLEGQPIEERPLENFFVKTIVENLYRRA